MRTCLPAILHQFSIRLRTSTAATLLLVLTAGCGGGGGGSGTGGGGQATISFISGRALDGSDSSNGIQGITNVWTVKSDGSGATALTHYSGTIGVDFGSSPPMWSPDGTKFTYTSGYALDGSNAANEPIGAQNVWVVNADGSGATPLTKLTLTNSFSPVWSPDGSKIAYYSRRAVDGSDSDTSTYNIWVINADGSNDHIVTPITTDEANSENPQWSPDSTRVAFDSKRALDGSDGGNGTGPYYTPNIWIVNADGSGATPITQQTTGNGSLYVVWSKAGELAFWGYGGDGNLWTVHSDGSGLTKLTANTCFQNTPTAWSPDGSKLVFISSLAPDGSNSCVYNDNIWIMGSDGSNPTPLTKLTQVDAYGGAFSPDGTEITYVSIRALDGSDAPGPNLTSNIWVINANGSSDHPLTRLTAWRADSYGGQWEP